MPDPISRLNGALGGSCALGTRMWDEVAIKLPMYTGFPNKES